MPWDLIKRATEATHPYEVFMVRSMLAVPFFEKALYELPEEQVTPEEVLALADQIEKDVEGGLAGRCGTALAYVLNGKADVTCTVATCAAFVLVLVQHFAQRKS